MKRLKELINRAIEKINSTNSVIQIVSHLDCDGIASASIMASTLIRMNKNFQITFVNRIDDELMKTLENRKPELVIFTDMGSGYLDLINELNFDSIVLDHHQIEGSPSENVIHINSEEFELKLSGSGVTYILAKEIIKNNSLAPLAIVGTLGDVSYPTNSKLFETPLIEVEIGLNLFGRFSRPLHKALEFSGIPGINEESKAIQFLSEIGIKPQKNGKWRTLSNLSEEEKRKLTDALIKESLKHEKFSKKMLFGNVLTLKNFPEELRDAKEFATILNACANMNEPSTGLALCLGNKRALETARNLLNAYRKILGNYLKWIENNPEKIKETNFARYILGEEFINENFIGTVVSILFRPTEKTLIGFGNSKDGIKISGRSKEVNIRDVLVEAAKACGGRGGGHCLSRNTLVQLKDGEIKKIAEIKEGDKLESLSLENLTNSNALCIKKFENKNEKKVYNIKTTYGFSLIASPHHKLFVLEADRRKITIKEKRLEDIKIGDFVAAVDIINPIGKIQNTVSVDDIINRVKTIGHRWKPVKIPKKLTPELAQFLGYFIGNGNIYNDDQLEFRDERKEVLETYQKLTKIIFGYTSKISKLKSKNCWRLRIFSSTIAIFIKRLLKNLTLIEKSPNYVIKKFLRGLFDAEGCVKKNEVVFTIKDNDIADRMHLLLLRFNICASKFKSINTNGDYINVLSIRGRNLEKFKKVNFSSKEKVNKFAQFKSKVSKIIPVKWNSIIDYFFINNPKIRRKIHYNRYISLKEWNRAKKFISDKNLVKNIDNIFNVNWVKVKSKNMVKNKEILYDLTTTEGNFIANGIIVHNSNAAGALIPSETREKFIEVCEKILKEKLNK